MTEVALNRDERRHRVVILLDVSGSMRGLVGDPLWPAVMALAQHAASAGGENSDIALMMFSDRVLGTVGFSQGRDAIRQRLEEVAKDHAFPEKRKASDSRIYDVLKEGSRMFGNPTSADSLLFITDGVDEGSKSNPDEIIDQLSSSMVRVFAILVDPVQRQKSSVGPDVFVRIVKNSGGTVFGPIDSANDAFRHSVKTPEAQKVMEEQLAHFYRGIFSNHVLTIEAPPAIQKPKVVRLSLTDSARHRLEKAQIHFPHEIGTCSDIGPPR